MKPSKRKHRVTVARRNLYGSRMWWMTCTCGYYQGYHDKAEAERTEHAHKEKAE